MADEPIPSQPADPPVTDIHPPSPPSPAHPTRNGQPPSRGSAEKRHVSASELRRFAGWVVGLLIVLACGWGLLALAFHYTWHNTHHPLLAFALAVVLDLGLFIFLEQNFWLSRLMGLRITEHSRAWQSAVLLWLFGVVGLFFRSTEPAPAAAPASRAHPRSSPQHEGSPDSIREIIETVVFVVVLVLMLRSFVAEAFVIPTGSMAETLYGYQRTVKCPDCGNTFEVNRSNQVDPSDGVRTEVTGCTCPYCRLPIDLISYELTSDSLTALRAAKVPARILDELESLTDVPSTPDNFEKELERRLRNEELRAYRDVIKKHSRFTTPRFIQDPPKGLVPDLIWDWSPLVWDWVPDWNSGDRVLVAKPFYDLVPRDPDRHDIVVFRFPGDEGFPGRSGPYRKDTQMNYIKRLIGKPEETIGIHRGKIYKLTPEQSPKWPDYAEAAGNPNKLAMLWQHQHMHMASSQEDPNDPAQKLWKKGEFHIVPKPPDVVLSMMRPVWDHDHPSQVMPERWTAPGGGWVADGRSFRSDGSASAIDIKGKAQDGDFRMLHYQHLVNRGYELTDQSLALLRDQGVPEAVRAKLKNDDLKGKKFESLRKTEGREGFFDALEHVLDAGEVAQYRDRIRDAASGAHQPELITDLMGYNTYLPHRNSMPGQNWVSDLILECEVVVPDKPTGVFVMELSKGHDRFQARWDLASPDGNCTLFRIHESSKEQSLDSKPTGVRGGGTHRLRFANVDDRLVVWVDGQLPFENGVPYEADKQHEGPTVENDLQRPAGIGVHDASVSVRQIKLFRDTYYTASGRFPNSADAGGGVDFGKPNTWSRLSDLPVLTMYVQPGHYLCLGDNSPESSDGRSWGTVPQRLLLGRAVLVYYPFARGGRIR
jgi:signal peptidase I